METKQWTNLERKDWPAGDWDGEPDKVQWQDTASGLPCIAVRHSRSGHWCGYVGVAEGHPAFQKSYDDADVRVHGGLTYADFCRPHDDEEGKGICHIAAPGEPDRVWWLGFDCAHSGDHSPEDAVRARDRQESYWRLDHGSQYRTLAYVQAECKHLAAQLKSLAA